MAKSKTTQTAPGVRGGGERSLSFISARLPVYQKRPLHLSPFSSVLHQRQSTSFELRKPKAGTGGGNPWRKQSRYLSRSRNWGGNTRAMPTSGAACPHGMNHHNASNYNHPKLAPRRHSLSPSDLTEVQDGPVAQPKDACGVVVVR